MNRTFSTLALLMFALAMVAFVVGPVVARDSGGGEVRVEGKLTAKTANSVTINGMTFPVTSSTKIEIADKPAMLAALVIGARTQVRVVVGVTVKVEQ